MIKLLLLHHLRLAKPTTAGPGPGSDVIFIFWSVQKSAQHRTGGMYLQTSLADYIKSYKWICRLLISTKLSHFMRTDNAAALSSEEV
uniref:Uncharacterized protein n=1 Tax=Rhizophora mucronata TaxID=61149 RepID=A0A2P2QTN0_RHIMU